MNLWSVAFSYRLGLGFHALNNEGADGSNLMQPRRIDVGEVTYDGISGEIIRHHILENFVNLCSARSIPVLPLSAGLHPDRGPIGIRAAAKKLGKNEVSNDNLFECVRKAIELCAVLDVGGYLAAWKEDAGGQKKQPVAEKHYLDSECVVYKDAEPVKRDSCFDVAWLVSEQPQDLTITQHSAFRNTFAMNSRFAQTMRSNVYGGVIRADLHRIGTDDYWYLQPNGQRRAIAASELLKRQQVLVEAIINFIASPTGAKVAAWAPHVFLTEGAILLSSSRTAPFVSPIRVNTRDKDAPVAPNISYATEMEKLKNNTDNWVWTFKGIDELFTAGKNISSQLNGK
jgi:CRISPR-associated autoregulator DevR family